MLHFFGWGIRWTIATIFFLGVMAAAGYFVFNSALSGGQHVTVPNAMGLELAEASARIAAIGLELGKPTLVQSDTIPKNLVIAQRPSAERVVRSGRKVHLTVSMGPHYLDAPNLLKMEWSKAQEKLNSTQFQVGKVARIPHTAPRDTVLAQDPPPGTTVENRDPINVLLSAGDESSVNFMPNLVGMSEDAARSALAPLGVTVQVTEVTEGDQTEVVLRQDPQPDAYVYAGQVVNIFIMRGKPEEEAKVYETSVTHKWTYDWYDKRILVRFVDGDGNGIDVTTLPPLPRDHEDAATRLAGYGRKFPVKYRGKGQLEIWENGVRVEFYNLRDGRDPAPSGSPIR